MSRIAFAAALLFAACAPAEEGESLAVAQPQQATYTATDYAFEGPDTLRPGLTNIQMVNSGEQTHHMVMVRLEDGKTAEDFFQMMQTAEEGAPAPEWVSIRGAAGAIGGGGTTGSTIDLIAGTYIALCFIADPADQVPHLAKGMTKQIVVAGDRIEAAPPVATAEIRMSDFAFAMDELSAGPNTIRVVNDGPDVHEVVLVRLDEGATVESYTEALMAGEGPPPGTDMGGMGALSSGLENWWEVDLAPGSYLIVCFVPASDGVPHVMKGMIESFTIS